MEALSQYLQRLTFEKAKHVSFIHPAGTSPSQNALFPIREGDEYNTSPGCGNPRLVLSSYKEMTMAVQAAR